MVEAVVELRRKVNDLIKTNNLDEARQLVEEVLEKAGEQKNEALKAEALRCKAAIMFQQLMNMNKAEDSEKSNLISQALELLEESSNLARFYGDAAQQAWVRLTRAQFRAYQLEMTRVTHLLEDALQRSKRNDDKHMVLETILHAANIHEKHGLLRLKEALIDEGLMLAQTLGKRDLLTWLLAYKAKIELLKGNLDSANTAMDEAYEYLNDAVNPEEITSILERLKVEEAYFHAQLSKMKSIIESMKEEETMYLIDLKVIKELLENEHENQEKLLKLGEQMTGHWQFNQYFARALYYYGVYSLHHGNTNIARRILELLSRHIRSQKGLTEFYRYLYESLSGLLAFIEKDVENSLDHFMVASRGLDVLSVELKLSNDVLLTLARVLNWIANLDAESLEDAKTMISRIIGETNDKGLVLLHAKALLAASIVHLVAGEFNQAQHYLEAVQQLVTRYGFTLIQNKAVVFEETLNKYDDGVPSEERDALLYDLVKTLDF